MNRAFYALPLVAVVCCIGIPLLLAGAGISLAATLKGGALFGLASFVVVAAALGIYVYAKDRRLHIELLAFADCPNAENARANTSQALSATGKQAEVTYVEVDTPDLAAKHRFLGSPSVRINGQDVEPAARPRTDFGLMCRTYGAGESVSGAPSVEIIREAIES